MISRIFSLKTLVFLSVLGFIAGAFFLLSKALAPRGMYAVREDLQAKRQSRIALDAEIALLSQRLNRLEKKAGEESIVRTNVAVKVLKPEPIQEVLILPAVTEAHQDILLSAENEGTVEWLGCRDGEVVQKGQELIKIDAQILLGNYQSAQAAEKLAESEFKRISELTAREVTAQSDLDRARAQWDQAQAAAAIARHNFVRATIVSPIDGKVDDIVPDLREFVKRGDLVARLVDISIMKINVNISEKDIGYFQVGQKAWAQKPEPYGGETTGTIQRMRYVADELSKTFLAEIWVDNADGAFRPGMITKASLVRRQREQAIVIPAFTVLPTEKGPIVYVERDGVAQARAIEVGIRRGMEFEITKGLEPGDRLIVSGQRNLSDGSLVRVVE